MSTIPKVSIIMGIYNCEDTLEKAIESIINQTYSNWELIMCDDCSKDNTYVIAKKYENKYPSKIKVIRNEKNLTLAPTLNKCIKLANGKYIARQDGDDFSDKDRLQMQVEYLEENPQYDLVGTNMVSFDENGQKGIHKLKTDPSKLDFLSTGKAFAHATIMIKKDVLISLNGYCEEDYANQAEDYELWSRFFYEGFKGINIDENLYWVKEDISAYKRRGAKRRIRGIKLNIKIYSKLKAPIICYKNIIKDIICIFIPTRLFSIYYKKRLKNV